MFPGDALQLLRTYKYFGQSGAGIFLFSRGGDVEEAMKIGRLIRRLRLTTYAPDRPPTQAILASPADKTNNVCASACVLVWVAGARRTGDLLILHRPYPTPESVGKLSDIEFEALEKNAILKVKTYLQEFELPQYYIDKMILTASRDGYMPSDEGLTAHPLPEIAGSLEELILSKCDTLSSIAQKDIHDYLSSSSYNPTLLHKLTKRYTVSYACEEEQLAELRVTAWIRENVLKANDECSSNAPSVTSEQPWRSTTEPTQAERTPSTQRETSAPDDMFYWRKLWNLDPHSAIDNSDLGDCQKQALHQITFEALDRWRHAKLRDVPPPEFSVDTSILETL